MAVSKGALLCLICRLGEPDFWLIETVCGEQMIVLGQYALYFSVRISMQTYHYVRKMLAESESRKNSRLVIRADAADQFIDADLIEKGGAQGS